MTPVASAALCGVGIALSVSDSTSRREKQLRQAVVYYYLFFVVAVMGLFLAAFFPIWYAWLYPVVFLMYIYYHLFYYRIIRMLTQTGEEQRLPPIHYWLPVGLALFLSIFVFVLPVGERIRLIYGLEARMPTEHTFSYYVFAARYPLDMLFSILYASLSLLSIYRFYRKLKASARTPVSLSWWIITLTVFTCISLFTSVIYLLVPTWYYGNSVWAIISALLLLSFHIELAYPVFVRKYELYVLPVTAEQRQYHGTITIHRLESYFRKKKPYLNPDYKIGDLVDALDVNRSVVSQFINRTYRVNFSRYVNRWRLKELNRLCKNSAGADVRLEKLVMAAGFTDIKHYRRVKLQEETPDKEECEAQQEDVASRSVSAESVSQVE
ncbi:MAG: hypothetical protein LBL97_00555 [Prevotellaceae bacterium]|nr:hypothetical protein [Prevotellaceae bacterium]